MPSIIATAAGLPEHRYPQAELTAQLQSLWAGEGVNLDRVGSLHANTTIETRYTAEPRERYLEMSGWADLNQAYLRDAVDLAERAVVALMAQVEMDLGDVAHLAFFSTTGIAVPSIDARLMNRLPFAPTLKRTPVYGLGCAAGAAGLARVADYLAGHPTEAAIALTVETCSLTIQPGDVSVANLIATGLFGDAAAAVLMVGDAHPLAAVNASAGRPAPLAGAGSADLAVVPGGVAETAGASATVSASASGDSAAVAADRVSIRVAGAPPAPRVVGARSVFFPGTERHMGWDVTDAGMRIVLSGSVPQTARDALRPHVDAFLAEHGLAIPDVGRWLCHPGGPRVVDAIEEGLGLEPGRLDDTRDLLRRVGNVSSSSVLLLLDEAMRAAAEPPGTWGLVLAMGPGFGAELVLVQW